MRICPACSIEFEPLTPTHTFCTGLCRNKHYNHVNASAKKAQAQRVYETQAEREARLMAGVQYENYEGRMA